MSALQERMELLKKTPTKARPRPAEETPDEAPKTLGEHVWGLGESAVDMFTGASEKEEMRQQGYDPDKGGPGFGAVYETGKHRDAASQKMALFKNLPDGSKVDIKDNRLFFKEPGDEKWRPLNVPGLDTSDFAEFVSKTPTMLGSLAPAALKYVAKVMRKKGVPTNFRKLLNQAKEAEHIPDESANRATRVLKEGAWSAGGASVGEGAQFAYEDAFGNKSEDASMLADMTVAAGEDVAGTAIGAVPGATLWLGKMLKGDLLPLSLQERLRDPEAWKNAEVFEAMNEALREAGKKEVSPTVAQLLDDPVFRKMQTYHAAKEAGFRNLLKEQEKDSERALAEYLNQTGVKGSGDSRAAIDAPGDVAEDVETPLFAHLRKENKRIDTELASVEERLIADMEDIKANNRPADSALGAEVKEVGVYNPLAKAEEEIDKLYSSLSKEAGLTKYYAPETVKKASSLLADVRGRTFSKDYGRTIDRLESVIGSLQKTGRSGTYHKPYGYAQLDRTLKDLRAMKREAIEKSGPGKDVSVYSEVIEALEADRAAAFERFPGLSDQATKVEQAYRAFQTKWKEGVLAKLNDDLKTGGKVQDSNVFKQIWGTDAQRLDHARTMVDSLKAEGQVETLAKLKEGILNDFAKVAASPRSGRWVDDHSEILRVYFSPKEMKIFKNTASAQKKLSDLKREQRAVTNWMNDDLLGGLAKADTGTVMDKLWGMRSTQFLPKFKRLQRLSPETAQSIRAGWMKRFVEESMGDSKNAGIVNLNKLNGMLGDASNRRIINELYGKETAEQLENVSEVARRVRSNESIDPTDGEVFNLGRLMVFGYLSHKAAVVRSLFRLSERFQENNLYKMLLDPERLKEAADVGVTEGIAKGSRVGARTYMHDRHEEDVVNQLRRKLKEGGETVKKLVQ